MTTPSNFQSLGLSINVYKPTIDTSTPSYTPRGTVVLEGIQSIVQSYSHTISAWGGYDSARFNIDDNQMHLEDWLDRLGYHVEVYNPDLEIIYAGFINSISLNLGGLSVDRGPLLDIGNDVTVVYSTVDTTDTPPILGIRTRTTAATDTDSQDRYGIIEKVLSVGGATDVTAAQVSDTWIAENTLPITSQSFRTGGQQLSVTITCEGYYNWLHYIYNQTANTGTRNVSDVITDVLTADVNGLFSTDYTQITANTLQTARYENDDKKALDYIKFLVSQGDANDVRYLFGIYANQRATYAQQPTDTEYVQRISGDDVETPQGAIVRPWDVLPGKWLFYPDFLVGKSAPTNKRDDPRYEFIESVTFSTPYNLSHTGSRLATLPQKLAKLGLGGVSA